MLLCQLVGIELAGGVAPVADADEGEVKARLANLLPVDLLLVLAHIHAPAGGDGGAGHIAVYGSEVPGGQGVRRRLRGRAQQKDARQHCCQQEHPAQTAPAALSVFPLSRRWALFSGLGHGRSSRENS